MSSWKKVLLGGAAFAALSGTSALADFTAVLEPNTRLANTTGNLQFSIDNLAPTAADGTVSISDFDPTATAELQQGNQITLTLSNGVFNVLPTNSVPNAGIAANCPAQGPGGTGTLNFQAGGAGSNFVTYEIDQADINLDESAPAANDGCVIQFSNIVIRSGSYNSSSGQLINITLSDLAGELTGVTVGSGSSLGTVDTDLTETLFAFRPGTTSTIRPDGDDDVDAGVGAEPGIEFIELDSPSLGELFDDDNDAAGTAPSSAPDGDPDNYADLGNINIMENGALSGSGATVEASSVDFEITGPFSDGIASVYIDDDECAPTVPAAPGRILGSISGNTASFPDTAVAAGNPLADLLAGGPGAGDVDLNVCVITDAATQNGTLLLAGQYSAEVTVTTSASTMETTSGNIDTTEYQNGKVTRIAYAFGSGAGYSWYMPVTTMTASPVIVLVKDDDGMEWTGVLEDPTFYPASNAGGVQDENTHVLYTAGDINAAVGGTPLSTESTRAGIWVFTAADATVGSTMLNPTGDLGSVTVFED